MATVNWITSSGEERRDKLVDSERTMKGQWLTAKQRGERYKGTTVVELIRWMTRVEAVVDCTRVMMSVDSIVSRSARWSC